MHRDIKLLFWIFMVAFMLFLVYTIVDYTFDAMDNPRAYTYYQTYKGKFTSEPDNTNPDVEPDRKWKGSRQQMPFMGYVHNSIIFMITGILVVIILGFIVLYLANKQQE